MREFKETGENADGGPDADSGEMNFERKLGLVNALLECDIMKSPGKRDTVVNQLRSDIRDTVQRDTNARVDVLNIVGRCGDFPGGMDELVGIVRVLEGPSKGMRRVDEVLKGVAGAGRRMADEDQTSQPPDKRALREAMAKSFNMDDLEVLCADIEQELHDNDVNLEVNLETVGGSGKKIKILKLIDYLDRRGYLNYLVNAIREARPGII